MEVKHFWNVTFLSNDANEFYEYMNTLNPGSYNIKSGSTYIKNWYPDRHDVTETTMIELSEEEALALVLAAKVKLQKLE